MVVVSTVIVGVGIADVTEVSATVATGVTCRMGALRFSQPTASTSIIKAKTIVKPEDLFISIRAFLRRNVEHASSRDEHLP